MSFFSLTAFSSLVVGPNKDIVTVSGEVGVKYGSLSGNSGVRWSCFKERWV